METLPRHLTEPSGETAAPDSVPWVTVLWNCDCHTFEEVARQLTRAIGCPYDEGMTIAWRVHHDGKAVVRVGSRTECDRVARVLGEIGLRATVVPA